MEYLKYDSYIEKYRPLIGIRYNTMKLALNLFLQSDKKFIIEIGTLRNNGSYYGDGQSTKIFGEFCQKFGKHLITVDILLKAIETCQEATKEYDDYIDYVIADSLDFLPNFAEWDDVGLVYLDGMDSDVNPKEAQKHELKEVKIFDEMALKGTVLLLDDNSLGLGGKTLLATSYLEKQYKNLVCDYQSLWLKQ
jgi:hypothetical protein